MVAQGIGMCLQHRSRRNVDDTDRSLAGCANQLSYLRADDARIVSQSFHHQIPMS